LQPQSSSAKEFEGVSAPTIEDPIPAHGMRTRLKDNIRQPKRRTYDTVAYLTSSASPEMTYFKLALQNQNWKQAMEEEFGHS
jgi:hypothetical protein